MVRSSRFSGTMQAACGRWASAIASISSVAAISRFSGIVEPVHQPVDILVGDVAPVLAQMGGDAVGAGRGGGEGGADRIGMRAAARVPDGRDMVDVDAEAEAACGSRRLAAPRLLGGDARRARAAARRPDRSGTSSRSERDEAARRDRPCRSSGRPGRRRRSPRPGCLDRRDRIRASDRPVVTTSSTSSTRCAGRERKPRRSSERRPSAARRTSPRQPSARAISWPMMIPPIAGETTRSIRAELARGSARPAPRPAARRAPGPSSTRAHLQVARAVQARGEDEMAFEQRAGGAEFGQNLVFGHRIFPGCNRPPALIGTAKRRLQAFRPSGEHA